MKHIDRLSAYLRQNGPNFCSAPELTHLRPAQRRRLRHKLNHRKAAALKRNEARRAGAS